MLTALHDSLAFLIDNRNCERNLPSIKGQVVVVRKQSHGTSQSKAEQSKTKQSHLAQYNGRTPRYNSINLQSLTLSHAAIERLQAC